MSRPPFTPKNDYDRFFHLTGIAIRNWTNLELQLWHFIAALLGVDQARAQIVLSFITSGRAQRGLISSLAETYMDDTHIGRFRGLMKRASRLSKERNLLAHSQMFISNDGNQNKVFWYDTAEKDGPVTFRSEGLNLNRVKMLGDATLTLSLDLANLIDEVVAQGKILTLPKMPL